MATKQTIDRALMILGAQYGHLRSKLSDEHLMIERELWHEEFAGTPDDVFGAAAKAHMRAAKFFPMLSEIIEQIHKFETIADGGDDWAAAWAATKSAIGRYGVWGTIDEINNYLGEKLPAAMADDARAIVQRLGWRELCNMDISQESTWRAQFRDIYTRIRSTRVDRQRMSPDVARMIAEMASRMSIDRARLQAPRDDADDEGGF